VPFGQIELAPLAVPAQPHRFGGWGAIEIVDKHFDRLRCHELLPLPRRMTDDIGPAASAIDPAVVAGRSVIDDD
jgi:hypothetical protein